MITTVDDAITHLIEPAVDPLLRCNVWHVRGRDRDLLVDTGIGISSLRAAARHLFDKSLTVVATHAHADHVGGLHEFATRYAHPLESEQLTEPDDFVNLVGARYPATLRLQLSDAGYTIGDLLVTAIPHAHYDVDAHRVRAAPATHLIEEGDVIDLGDRAFTVLHLPGHSPGSIGLWDESTGVLFSGDAVYDGPLLDELDGSNIDDYCQTMERLRTLPVAVVHGGHDPSFGRQRLVELCEAYLASRTRRVRR